MQNDTNPVVPVDPTMTPVVNTTPAPVVDISNVTTTPAMPTVAETVTETTPGPEAVKVELPEVEESVTTPVVTVPPTV